MHILASVPTFCFGHPMPVVKKKGNHFRESSVSDTGPSLISVPLETWNCNSSGSNRPISLRFRVTSRLTLAKRKLTGPL